MLRLLPACQGEMAYVGSPGPGQGSGNLLMSDTVIPLADEARFPGICISSPGELMVAYRKSANHHQDGNSVIAARWSTDGGVTWSPESTVYTPGVDTRDVTLTALSDGRIAMTGFSYNSPTDYKTRIVFSTNHGRTFSAPVDLSPTSLTRVNACSGPVIELSDGKLLIALYGDSDENDYQSAVVLSSTNGGVTWGNDVVIASGPGSIGDAYGPESQGGFYEPFMTLLNDDSVLAAVRHDREKVWFTKSTDNGNTWSAISKSALARGGRPAICQVGETGALVLSDRRDTNQLYTTSWDSGFSWPNSNIIMDTGFRGAYAQMVEYSPGVLAHVWSMENNDGSATLKFTCLYDSNLSDPL